MAEHTQGPWSVITTDMRRTTEPSWYKYTVVGPNIPWGKDIELADVTDARLIAAAPETLAMLEESLPHLEDYFGKEYGDDPPENDLLERVRAVIAKAKGE